MAQLAPQLFSKLASHHGFEDVATSANFEGSVCVKWRDVLQLKAEVVTPGGICTGGIGDATVDGPKSCSLEQASSVCVAVTVSRPVRVSEVSNKRPPQRVVVTFTRWCATQMKDVGRAQNILKGAFVSSGFEFKAGEDGRHDEVRAACDRCESELKITVSKHEV